MIVHSNLAAMTALSSLKKNGKKADDNLEQVQTGEKLPTVRHDSSAYSISERMRSQIRALDQNSANTNEGIDMLQNAAAAIQSQIDIMRTIKAKVIDAANDSNTDEDRAIIQKELNQMFDQLEEIATTTKYNNQQLLVGDEVSDVVISWAVLSEAVEVPNSDSMNVINEDSKVDGESRAMFKPRTDTDPDYYDIDYNSWFSSNPQAIIPDDLYDKGFRSYCSTCNNQWWNFIFYDGQDTGRPSIPQDVMIDVSKVTDAESLVNAILTQSAPHLNHTQKASSDTPGVFRLYDPRPDDAIPSICDGIVSRAKKSEKNLYEKRKVIQDTEKSNSYITIHIPQTTLSHIFYSIAEPGTIKDYPITTKDGRSSLLGVRGERGLVDLGIEYLLDAETEIGAQMQRIEVSNSNITTKRENAQSSESTIRDADMAKSMVNYTKHNILSQASQSMLAQSNQNAGNVLELIG